VRFLFDEDLPRSMRELIRRYGYEAVDVRGIGLHGTKDLKIAAHIRENNMCLITGDFGFSDIRNYPPSEYAGIVVLDVPNDATSRFILDIAEKFFCQRGLVFALKGTLAILESGRVRMRRG